MSGSPGDGAARFADIPTRWSHLKGPPRVALDYLFRTYGNAVLAYVRGRLARGDFRPLTADDAEDVFQDFFLRLGQSEWLSKPDPRRGRFRPYLVRRLVFFLRERRATAAGRPVELLGEIGDHAIQAVTAPDPLDRQFESEWKAASVRECLRRIGTRNESWRAALEADLQRDTQTDAQLASRLGWTLESLRSVLKRARAAFRDEYRAEERLLEGASPDSVEGGSR